MAELTDAQKVLRNDTGKRMAAALETLAQNSEAPIGLGMTGATVGQVPVVKTVDANGVPTSYEPGAGAGALPAGGSDGDVLVKSGATGYDARWTNTPKQMGSLATIEPTSTVTQKTQYVQGEYLVYNGQLYKVTATTITQGQTLTPGGNIQLITDGGINDLKSLIPMYEKGQHTVEEIPFFGWVTVSATALDCYASLPALLPKNAQVSIESIGGVIARTSTGTSIPNVPTGSGLNLQIQNRGTILRIVIFKNDGYGVTNNIIVNGMLQNVVFTIS